MFETDAGPDRAGTFGRGSMRNGGRVKHKDDPDEVEPDDDDNIEVLAESVADADTFRDQAEVLPPPDETTVPGFVDKYGYELYAKLLAACEDAEDARWHIEVGYAGPWTDLGLYMEYQLFDPSVCELSGTHVGLRCHIDYDGLARTRLALGHIFLIEHEGLLHVFSRRKR